MYLHNFAEFQPPNREPSSGDFAGRLRNQKPWGSKKVEKNTEALEMDLDCVKSKRTEKASYGAVDKPRWDCKTGSSSSLTCLLYGGVYGDRCLPPLFS